MKTRFAVAVAGVLSVGVLVGCGSGSGSPQHRNNTTASRLPPITVADLKGHSPAVVRGRMGAPAFTRRERPAEIWQYASNACVIDIVFYPDHTGSLTADWLDSRTPEGYPFDKNACLRTIRRWAEGTRSGQP